MIKLTEDQIQNNLTKFYGFITDYISEPRCGELLKMYNELEITLATSPASAKKDYHNCFAGGYVEHVNRVVESALVLDRVWDKFGQTKNYTIEELVFSAISHDLGKLGTNEQPFYIPNTSQWHIDNQGAYYKYNDKVTHMRHSDRSLYTLQQFRIAMSENEYLAIKLHDGMFEESNKAYYVTYNVESQIKSNLIYILHQADSMASRIETQINK
jgi:hypothetical protein